MKAAISWQTLQVLANPYLRAKAQDVVDVPLTSANCLQSYLSGSSCWSRSRSCQHHANGREERGFPNLSSRSQTTAFLHLSGDLLALYGTAMIACTCPNICCGEPTELQSVPGTAFKVLPKWTGVSQFDLQSVLCHLKFIISLYLNRARNQYAV